jgi:hypothetical protein
MRPENRRQHKNCSQRLKGSQHPSASFAACVAVNTKSSDEHLLEVGSAANALSSQATAQGQPTPFQRALWQLNNQYHRYWPVTDSHDNKPASPTHKYVSAERLPRDGGNVPCNLLECIALETRQRGRQTANETHAVNTEEG